MEPETRYAVVGSAVLILLALLAAAVLWLRSTGEGRDARQYKIYFERQSLEGLEIRSDVKMRGIRVGSVSGFRFSSQRRGAVEVFITVASSTPVRETTSAIVERHLVTGLASVRLVNVEEDSPPLTQAPPGESYPVIAEGESPIQQVSETLNQLAQHADETMQRINATLSPANQAALTETLQNLRRLSTSASSALARVEGTLKNMDGTLASAGRAADKVGALSDSLQKESTGALREIAGAVRQMQGDVARLSQQADALVASGDSELRATAQSLRTAADALGTAAQRLGDPQSVLFGPPPGGLGPGEGGR